MNARAEEVVDPVPPAQPNQAVELSMPERVRRALALAKSEDDLKVLAAQSTHITAITNEAGYQQVHAARMVLKNERINIEKLAKAARDDAVQFSKATIAGEKRLIGLIEPEEKRLQALQDAEDEKVEAEKRAKVEVERKRVERHQALLRFLPMIPAQHVNSDVETLNAAIQDAVKIQPSSFEEFEAQAEEAQAALLAQLRRMVTAREQANAESARLAAERAELARLRAEAAEREAAERARIAEQQRKADEVLAAERAELARQQKAAREALEAEQAASRAAREQADREAADERRRQDEAAASERARQQAVIDAENKRLADERAAQQAEQARKEAAARAKKRPTDAEIVQVLADHYRVTTDTVVGWLSKMSLSTDA